MQFLQNMELFYKSNLFMQFLYYAVFSYKIIKFGWKWCALFNFSLSTFARTRCVLYKIIQTVHKGKCKKQTLPSTYNIQRSNFIQTKKLNVIQNTAFLVLQLNSFKLKKLIPRDWTNTISSTKEKAIIRVDALLCRFIYNWKTL